MQDQVGDAEIVRTALSSDFSFFCYQLFFTSLSTTSLSPSISCPRFVSFSFLWHAFLLAIFAPGVPFSPSLALNISCPRHLFLLTSLAMSSRQALIISFSWHRFRVPTPRSAPLFSFGMSSSSLRNSSLFCSALLCSSLSHPSLTFFTLLYSARLCSTLCASVCHQVAAGKGPPWPLAQHLRGLGAQSCRMKFALVLVMIVMATPHPIIVDLELPPIRSGVNHMEKGSALGALHSSVCCCMLFRSACKP